MIEIKRSTLRYVALGIGGVALLVFILAWIVSPGNQLNNVAYIALAVSLLGFAGYVLADPEAASATLTGRTGRYALTSWLMGIFFIILIVALFAIVRELELAPIDVTENQQYRLSEQSIDILQNLEEPIEAIAFYSVSDSFSREEAELWLQTYGREAGDNFEFRFVDPDRSPAEAARYNVTSSGVIVIAQGDRTAEATFANEQQITQAIVRVLRGDPIVTYFTTGHGERNIEGFAPQDYGQVAEVLERNNYQISAVNIATQGAVPEDADLLIIAGPISQFSPTEVDSINAYLAEGGKVLLLADPGGTGGTGGAALGGGVLGVDYDSRNRIVTGGNDGTVKIWSPGGNPINALSGHSAAVLDVEFSPDDRQIASASADGTIRIWDASEGDELAQLQGHSGGVAELAFSPNGDYLASVGADQVLRVYDMATMEPLYSPLATEEQLFDVSFSPDSSLVAAVGAVQNQATGVIEGSVLVWEAESGELVLDERLHSDLPLSLAFSPDGATLHSVARDGTEGIIDLEEQSGNTTTVFDAGITSIAFTPAGDRVYALLDATIHIRPADTSGQADDRILEGHSDVIWSMAVSENGAALVSASGELDGSIRIWDVATGSQTAVIEGAHTARDPLLTYFSENWGITVNDDVVVDLLVEVGDQLSPVIRSHLTSPPASPVMQVLAASGRPFFLQVAHSVITDPQAVPASISVTTLASTNASGAGQVVSWAEKTDPFVSQELVFNEGVDVVGPVAVGATAENFDTGARVVIIGDADFATNNALQFTTYGNSDLVLSSANWLVEGEEALDLPASNFEQATMDRPFSGVELTLVQIGVTCLLPLVLLGVGATVWLIRRSRR